MRRVVQERMARWHALVADRKLRTTAQRNAVVQVFFAAEGHLDLEEIHRRARLTHPRVGFATVYRTMRLLCESGLGQPRHFGGATRYEPGDMDDHHDHLVCTSCGEIVEFQNEEIERLQQDVARVQGFSLTRHKMELYGLCRKCGKHAHVGQDRHAHAGHDHDRSRRRTSTERSAVSFQPGTIRGVAER